MHTEQYVAVIFTSQRTGADDDGYIAEAARMEALAAEQPGYLGIESARSPSGLGITVSYWVDAAAAGAWKRHNEHLAAQQAGRTTWYDRYTVRVATVEREYGSAQPIFHLALTDDWRAAQSAGDEYTVSTRGLTLDQVGFVHCSYHHQLVPVANRFYADVDELTILELDRDRLDADVRPEPGESQGTELFPHLYGAIPIAAIVTATRWQRGDDGRWSIPDPT